MNHKALITIILCIALGGCNTPLKSSVQLSTESDESIIFFKQVISKIEKEYIEPVEKKDLVEHAIDGMLTSLDPYSNFYNTQNLKEEKTSISGEFGGLGLEITIDNGLIKVISPYQDSPAQKAGIEVGDYIISVDDQPIKGMKIVDAVEKLRGKPGTNVKLSIFRESTRQTIDLKIKRTLIDIAPIQSKIISQDVAYIMLPTFNDKTIKEISLEIQKMFFNQKTPMKGLVLDLRFNPGGILEQALDVADLFLDSGEIVSIKDKVETKKYYASIGDIIDGLPIVVIINKGSASAAEIVAGALQDNKRAIIVGEKSFGKGSVQMIFQFSNSTAIKLTTAKYFTPLDKSIHGIGIIPDIIISPLKLFIGSESIEGDYQLIRAVDLIKGMALYTENLSQE